MTIFLAYHIILGSGGNCFPLIAYNLWASLIALILFVVYYNLRHVIIINLIYIFFSLIFLINIWTYANNFGSGLSSHIINKELCKEIDNYYRIHQHYPGELKTMYRPTSVDYLEKYSPVYEEYDYSVFEKGTSFCIFYPNDTGGWVYCSEEGWSYSD